MERYDVYLYNVPKVNDDKVVPIRPHRTETFSDLNEATKFAEANRKEFERVVVMKTSADAQQLVDRYIDGVREQRGNGAAAQA